MARAGNALRNILAGRARSFTRVADPVRRLCRLATSVVAGGGFGDSALLLDEAAFRCFCTRTAHRSTSSRSSELPRRKTIVGIHQGLYRSASGPQPQGGSHSFHDLAGGLSNPAPLLQRTRGHCRGYANRRTNPLRDRGTHWLL